MTGDDTERGQPFDGRYRVLGRLGVGGMATVYLAEDSSLGRKVALKVMAERYSEDGEFVERFRREAQAAARLNHPNIIAVYDRGEANGRPRDRELKWGRINSARGSAMHISKRIY